MEIEEKNSRPRIPNETRWRIIGFLESGKSHNDAAKFYGYHQTAISKLWKKFMERRDVNSKTRPGRPLAITQEKRTEIASALSEPKVSLKQVAIEYDVSKTSVFNIAKEFCLEYKYFNEEYEINENTAQKRKNYSNQWFDKDLSNMVFCDESYFHIFRNTIGSWTIEKKIIIEKVNPNYALMVFGAISAKGKSSIEICDKGFKINSETYIAMLEKILLPFLAKNHQANHEFLQDNARSHISKKTENWLSMKKINVIQNYPPYSPDFNAIEGIWKLLKDLVEKKQPKNIQELKHAII